MSTEFEPRDTGGFGYVSKGAVVRKVFAATHDVESRSKFFFEYFLERFDLHVSVMLKSPFCFSFYFMLLG